RADPDALARGELEAADLAGAQVEPAPLDDAQALVAEVVAQALVEALRLRIDGTGLERGVAHGEIEPDAAARSCLRQGIPAEAQAEQDRADCGEAGSGGQEPAARPRR